MVLVDDVLSMISYNIDLQSCPFWPNTFFVESIQIIPIFNYLVRPSAPNCSLHQVMNSCVR